jgi:hypothetical protein
MDRRLPRKVYIAGAVGCTKPSLSTSEENQKFAKGPIRWTVLPPMSDALKGCTSTPHSMINILAVAISSVTMLFNPRLRLLRIANFVKLRIFDY